jgi:hypothetical protein
VEPRKPPDYFLGKAKELQRMGYTGSVVARKLIDEHDMPESEASALVSRLYGAKVDPHKGDTATAVVFGLVLAGTGALGLAALWFIPFRVPAPLWLLSLTLLGSGLARTFISLINAGGGEPPPDSRGWR